MSDLDLDAIKAREQVATSGPWAAQGGLIVSWTSALPTLSVATVTNPDQVCQASHDADAAFIVHARKDVPELVAEVERLRRALRSIAYTDHMTAAAARFARNALAPRPARHRSEASEPRCGLCGYDQHVAHHLSPAAKGYHPFVSHDRG